jgi:hypothetical protein
VQATSLARVRHVHTHTNPGHNPAPSQVTFLAGVYGTNFTHFPEIHFPLGIAYFWCLCIGITILFLTLLHRWGMFER